MASKEASEWLSQGQALAQQAIALEARHADGYSALLAGGFLWRTRQMCRGAFPGISSSGRF